MSNGQTTVATTGPDSKTTDPTRLTTEALMREIEVINRDIDRRFQFYDRLLEEADRRRVEQKEDTKAAVDAALAAAKEAVKEQNLSTEKAIGKSETLFFSSLENIKIDVSELKKFRDTSMGRQTATVALIGVAFAIVTVALRFI